MNDFENAAKEAISKGIIPGGVFLATNDTGSWSYSKALSGPDSNYSLDSILEIASLTKLVTTVAALQLVERGLIALDENVEKYLPIFAKQPVFDPVREGDEELSIQERRYPITFHHLLTHTAGSGYGFTDERVAKYIATSQDYKPDGTIDGAFNFPFSYDPGEGWCYSNSLDRVGQIIEKISGLSLEDYFHQNIFRPLGISKATFDPNIYPRQPMAVRKEPDGRAIPDPDAQSFTSGLKECFGGQGLLMSLEDYIKILTSLLRDDEVLLSKATTAMMLRPQLSHIQKQALLKELEAPVWAVGDLPPTQEYDWGYGGLLIDGDKHPFRRRNSLLWSGAPSLFWFIDRAAGVCGVFGTQVLPPSDPMVKPLIDAFEKAVYAQAGYQKEV